jgi:hypothetical protein
MLFSGANLPTDATATIEFGDGSPNVTMAVTSTSFLVSHLYEIDDNQGNYSTMIHVSNLVDYQSFMVSYQGVEGPVRIVYIQLYLTRILPRKLPYIVKF